MSNAEFLFLGTGGSAGIPMIGCQCEVCLSEDAYNKRLRPSALLNVDGKRVLIDAGPDFRCQALRYQIHHLDGLLLTHSHFDHIAGLDELRVYYLKTRMPLPVLLAEPTYIDLKKRYDYLFRPKNPKGSLTAQLDFQILEGESGETTFLNLKMGYTRFEQAGMSVTGFRFGSLAYISDIRSYHEKIFQDLSGVKILILSALRSTTSIMHFNLDEAIRFAEKSGAEITYLTHMSHELEHRTTQALLPKDVQLAYDGLKLDFEYPF